MGKLFVVGIGPGGPDGMTIAARRALEAADIVVGYTKYVELALAAVPDAAHLATPMMHEVERCRLALSRAQSGEAVALVCSGDAGVYGMASPVLELAEDYPDVDVEVIAGATAAQSGSAVLGAPLAHDFAVVSLSDLLTPWEVIERTLAAVEKNADDRYMEFIRTAKFVPFGAEVPIGYLAGLDASVRNLRILLAGKAAGLSADTIRGRIRNSYV